MLGLKSGKLFVLCSFFFPHLPVSHLHFFLFLFFTGCHLSLLTAFFSESLCGVFPVPGLGITNYNIPVTYYNLPVSCSITLHDMWKIWEYSILKPRYSFLLETMVSESFTKMWKITQHKKYLLSIALPATQETFLWSVPRKLMNRFDSA